MTAVRVLENPAAPLRKIGAILFLICLLGTGAAFAADSLKVTHALGTATVPMHPKRVVAFDLSVLDSMDAMGVTGVEYAMPKQVVPDYLKKFQADSVVDAGGMKDPNLEKIYEFGPDVIFISPRQTDYYNKLSEIAPTVCTTVDYRDFFGSFKNTMHILGQVFDMEDAADQETRAVYEKAKRVAEKAEKSGKNALIIMVNDGAISAYGPGSRFGMVHDVLKIPPAEPGIRVSNHGQSIDFEYLARINPDILLVINRNFAIGLNGSANVSIVLDNELVQRTKAGKNGKIINLDSSVWYLAGAGLESLNIMIDEIDAALNYGK